ncbi:MAG: GNAT family N-acetyltransferase [Gemmatimonadales bacterium]
MGRLLVLCMGRPFRGYIQTVCLRDECRGRGLGTAVIAWAEERIFRESPNAFICVSDFNTGARRLYERLGYEVVGTLSDFLVAGHSEVLLRKSRGPWDWFRPG